MKINEDSDHKIEYAEYEDDRGERIEYIEYENTPDSSNSQHLKKINEEYYVDYSP